MPILHNIPPKPNHIPTGHIKDALDPSRKQHVPIGFDGLSYNSSFTPNAFSNAPHHNTATILQLPAMQVQQPGVVVRTQVKTRLLPSDTHVLAHAKPHVLVRRSGGPSPTSNTPFHPQPMAPRPAPNVRPAVTTDRYRTATAVALSQRATKVQPGAIKGSPVEPVGSFLHMSNQTLVGHSNRDSTNNRWATIKTGAAG